MRTCHHPTPPPPTPLLQSKMHMALPHLTGTSQGVPSCNTASVVLPPRPLPLQAPAPTPPSDLDLELAYHGNQHQQAPARAAFSAGLMKNCHFFASCPRKDRRWCWWVGAGGGEARQARRGAGCCTACCTAQQLCMWLVQAQAQARAVRRPPAAARGKLMSPARRAGGLWEGAGGAALATLLPVAPRVCMGPHIGAVHAGVQAPAPPHTPNTVWRWAMRPQDARQVRLLLRFGVGPCCRRQLRCSPSP